MNGADLYRSLNCMSLSSRGIYCLYIGNVKESMVLTCNMFISYNIVDIYLLYKNQIRRNELWCHHIFSLCCYLHLWGSESYNDCLMGHLILITEFLSIFNSLLRNKITYLKLWRLFVLLCVRLPLWIYIIYLINYTDSLNTNFYSQILYKLGSVIMPIIDFHFLKKIIRR